MTASRFRAAVLLLAATLVAPHARAAKWESPDFASGASRPHRIAILPARSEMVRTRLNEALPFVKETRQLEEALRREAGAAIGRLGYEPDVETLSPARIAEDRELQALARDLEHSVSDMIDVAAGRPKDIGRGRFSVGEAVLPLATRTGADGFLWLQSQSIVPSKGQRTLASVFSVLSGSYGVPTNHTQLIAVLVDGKTGDLASVVVSAVGGAVLKEPDRVAAKAVAEALRQWPAPGVSRRVSERARTAAATAEKPRVVAPGEELDEFALVARFEDAAARLDGAPTAGVPEIVATRDEFTANGASIAADGAAIAAPVSVFEAAPAVATSLSPAEPGAPGLPAPRALWEAPAAARPAPAREIVLQMLDGAPGIRVRNMLPDDVLVSIDLGEWTRLALGAQLDLETPTGSRRILLASPEGTELARASVLVHQSRASVEIWGTSK